MQISCTKCQKDNRSIALYCKYCGNPLLNLNIKHPSSLDQIIGLPEIKAELEKVENVIKNMKSNGSLIQLNYNTIVMGNAGTAKTLIGNVFYELLKENGIVKGNKLYYLDAVNFKAEELQKAKDELIIIDNVHLLIDGNKGSDQLNRLLSEMAKFPNNPIVFLSGLSYGLKEFLSNPENKHITARFKNIFHISDYNPVQLCEIIEKKLNTHGFSVATSTKEKLMQRCTFLIKKMKDNQSNLDMNGHLAVKETQGLQEQYFMRNGKDKVILDCDIIGEVYVPKSLDGIMSKLDSLIGMTEIKNSIRGFAEQQKTLKERKKLGYIQSNPVPLHFVITGNPGTGKNTVIRLLGEILEAIGILELGTVIEVDESKIIGEYIGQTAPNMNRLCDQAMGGILFIDEAYSLVKSGSGNNFGMEAINALLKRMEDDRGKFMVIVAGYKNLMDDFLSSNPGLNSRFPYKFHIDDYNEEELLRIFEGMAKKENYILSPSAISSLRKGIKQIVISKTKDFANGREIRNLFDKVISLQSQRINKMITGEASVNKEVLQEITEQDIPFAKDDNESVRELAIQKLNALIGLQSIKIKINRILSELEVQKLRGQQKLLTKHFVFSGNPGTGKTTVARILADVFKAINLLPTNNLIEVSRGHMVGAYKGHTAKEVDKICDRAMGGILFIDEAYTLNQGSQDDFGKEAIDTLLTRMENDRGKFVVIAAGYTNEMHNFIETNPGLKSRFTEYIEFDDYNGSELTEIFKYYARDEKYQLSSGLEENILAGFDFLLSQKDVNFGNAREVRNIFNKTTENLSIRISQMQKEGYCLDDLQRAANIIQHTDLPF